MFGGSHPAPVGAATSGHEGARLLAPSVAWGALLLVAGLAWVLVIVQARAMGNGPGTMGMGLPVFLLAWLAMMVAMMLPSVAPVALLWTRTIRARSTGLTRGASTAQFLAGYLLAWSGFGLIAYFALTLVEWLIGRAPTAAGWLGLGIFGVAGVYQLTPLKNVCLRHCQSPLAALLHYANFKGQARDLRVGLHHGAYCVGCCWGLMIVLAAVGVMNLAAMLVLAAAIALEKLWSRGALVSRAIGIGFLLFAVLAFIHPEILPGLTPEMM